MTQTLKNFTTWAEIQVVYKTKVKPSERIAIKSSQSAYEIFKEMFEENMDHFEKFAVIMLNRANKVIGVYTLSSGGIDSTVLDPRMLFQIALKANSSSLILGHNHPSGNLTPSESDIVMTRQIKQGGDLLQIRLLDHIVVTSESYYSMADEGKL